MPATLARSPALDLATARRPDDARGCRRSCHTGDCADMPNRRCPTTRKVSAGSSTSSPHDTQQGVLADRQHQPLGKAFGGTTAQGKAEMMDYDLEPRRAARRRRQNLIAKALSEDAASGKMPTSHRKRRATMMILTLRPDDGKSNAVLSVAAVDAARSSAARRARPRRQGSRSRRHRRLDVSSVL